MRQISAIRKKLAFSVFRFFYAFLNFYLHLKLFKAKVAKFARQAKRLSHILESPKMHQNYIVMQMFSLRHIREHKKQYSLFSDTAPFRSKRIADRFSTRFGTHRAYLPRGGATRLSLLKFTSKLVKNLNHFKAFVDFCFLEPPLRVYFCVSLSAICLLVNFSGFQAIQSTDIRIAKNLFKVLFGRYSKASNAVFCIFYFFEFQKEVPLTFFKMNIFAKILQFFAKPLDKSRA